MPPIEDNPLLRRSTLPYQLPPFDQIRDEHFAPAFDAALTEHLAEIERIATDPAPPTFDNTLVALECSGETLRRVSQVFHNLTASHTNPVLRRLEEEMAPRLAAHRDAIYLDSRLFQRIHQLYERRDQLDLDPESAWLLERYHTDFVRAGARLDPPGQQRLREINQQLSGLLAMFDNRLRSDTNDLAITVRDASRLAGLSSDAVAAAAEAAKERGLDGHVLTLILPTDQPALANLDDRRLREEIHRAAISRGARGNAHDTRELVRQIVALRAERAALLGYPHHASYQIADGTAGSLEAVKQMLAQLVPPAVANVRTELAALREVAAEDGGDVAFQPWDWSYYAERVRRRRYDVDSAALRPYFWLDRVLTDGVFFAAERLYGVSFAERTDLPTYHPQVRVYEVFDADGSALGLFLADFFTRESKRGGAWQSTFVAQSHLRARARWWWSISTSIAHRTVSRRC